MNKMIVFISFAFSAFFINEGISARIQMDNLKNEDLQLQANISDMRQRVKAKGSLLKRIPVPISMEYSVILNQVRMLQYYSGINMNVQLDGVSDTQDIASHYESTEYRGIRGLKIKIIVDRFPQESDIGVVLNDFHLLEKNADFKVSEISKDNDRLTVKGEVYGL